MSISSFCQEGRHRPALSLFAKVFLVFSCKLLKVTCSQKFAFAQWSGAMKAPVGLLSDRTVLRSKMEGPRPDKFAFAKRSGAMKAPVGLFSDRTVLCSKMEGPRPDKFHFYAKESRLCKRCAESVQPLSCIKERTPNLTIWRSKSGAPSGTRTLGPLIKRASRRFVSIYGSFKSSLFYIKTT